MVKIHNLFLYHLLWHQYRKWLVLKVYYWSHNDALWEGQNQQFSFLNLIRCKNTGRPYKQRAPIIDIQGVKHDLAKMHWCILYHLTIVGTVFLYTGNNINLVQQCPETSLMYFTTLLSQWGFLDKIYLFAMSSFQSQDSILWRLTINLMSVLVPQ